MIFQTPVGISLDTASTVAEHATTTSRTYEFMAASDPPAEVIVEGFEGEQSELCPAAQDLVEEFVWEDPKVEREFIKLQQKFLAKKASSEEAHRYQSMKRHRNSLIFADRYVRDYAEVQRLRKLSEKLAEVQQYLQPIKL